ncbi:MAG: hypothetical protein SFU57_03840 [Gemmatimonadales bacterium]|nr:hypothetical protein [Gemmatimonadales bacterium]
MILADASRIRRGPAVPTTPKPLSFNNFRHFGGGAVWPGTVKHLVETPQKLAQLTSGSRTEPSTMGCLMNRTKPLIDCPSPSRKPKGLEGSLRVVNTTPPPDMEAFKDVRSFGLKGLREKLEAKRKKR